MVLVPPPFSYVSASPFVSAGGYFNGTSEVFLFVFLCASPLRQCPLRGPHTYSGSMSPIFGLNPALFRRIMLMVPWGVSRYVCRTVR
jgi:hypothetical protein